MPPSVSVNQDDSHGPHIHAGGSYTGPIPGPHHLTSPEVPEFVPTRHELLALAKYWVDVSLYWATFMWVYQTYCRSWLFQESYALGRVDRIADVVGREVVDVVVQPVVESYRSRLGDDFWHRYVNGQSPPEEWLDAVHSGPGPDAAQPSQRPS